MTIPIEKIIAKSVIFDLDGTLIDSSTGIISALNAAFDGCRIAPKKPINSRIIGPPLEEIIRILSGSEDPLILDRLARQFIKLYDSDAYKLTAIYNGIHDLLSQLYSKNIPMYVVTNKREKPSKLILDYFGWNQFFKQVYALDAFKMKVSNKSELLTLLVIQEGLLPAECIYVGDRPEDKEAAKDNNMSFFWAYWGFGTKPKEKDKLL